ncbi:MAG: VOC family protein [Promicromonosporaceae bacterium]|nr:VOC family protein [Promicromonosporaceae bacterium]
MPTMTVEMITFDSTDPRALATWWARYTDGTVHDDSAGEFVMVTSDGLRLGFQRVPDPTPGKNRLHLDLTVVDRRTVAEMLVADGAKLVANHEESGFCWTVLADPDGNVFCITQHNGA